MGLKVFSNFVIANLSISSHAQIQQRRVGKSKHLRLLLKIGRAIFRLKSTILWECKPHSLCETLEIIFARPWKTLKNSTYFIWCRFWFWNVWQRNEPLRIIDASKIIVSRSTKSGRTNHRSTQSGDWSDWMGSENLTSM